MIMSIKVLRPMLAAKDFVIYTTPLRWPIITQKKFDGIRFLIKDKVAVSRVLKPLPNKYFQAFINFMGSSAHGLDGEVLVGSPNSVDVYNKTQSGIMSINGKPECFIVLFDNWNIPKNSYPVRYKAVETWLALNNERLNTNEFNNFKVILVNNTYCNTYDDLIEFQQNTLAKGYEGVILRSIDSPYKYGRSTLKEGGLIKWKEWTDSEAKIVDFIELMHNDNKAEINNLGLTKRSSHQDNKMPGNTLGAFLVQQDFGDGKGLQQFQVGTGLGLTQDLRKEIWNNRSKYLNMYIKYKHFLIGRKDLPRQPIFLGFRNLIDM